MGVAGKMIREVFIFRHTTGELLFGYSTNVQWEDIDKSLVTSFLSALFQFSKELGEAKIRSLVMSDSVYHYNSWKDITFTLVTKLDYDPELVIHILEEIKTRFLNRFYGILNSWEGCVETFTKFSEVVKQSLLELDKQNKILHIFPHSILVSNGDISPLPRDAEIASIFTLAEKHKKKQLLGRSKETIVTFSKLLVPIFIEPLQDGFLLIDGLGLCHSDIWIEHVPNFTVLKKQLYVADHEDISSILHDINEILVLGEEEKELDSILDITLLEPTLLESLYESVTDFAHLVVPSLDEDSLINRKEQFLNRKREIQQAIYSFNELTELIEACGEAIKAGLEECYKKTKQTYDHELELLESQIGYNLGLLEDEHTAKQSKILQTYDEKQRIIRVELQNVGESFSELFTNISATIGFTLTQELNEGSQKEQTEEFLEHLTQLLDTLVNETQIVQERYQGLKSTVRRKKTELNQLELACKEELNLLKNEYKERIRAEKQTLTSFEEKIVKELSKIRHSIDSIDEDVKSTLHLIDLKITKLQNQDKALSRFICKEMDLLNAVNKIYIPFYLIQYTKPSAGLRSEVIPPVRIVKEAKGTARIEYYSNFEGYRTKLLQALDKKTPIAEALYAARETPKDFASASFQVYSRSGLSIVLDLTSECLSKT